MLSKRFALYGTEEMLFGMKFFVTVICLARGWILSIKTEMENII
jgi:hypothetical protein